jgi:hypothetical protein
MVESLGVLRVVDHLLLCHFAGLSQTHHQRRRQSARSEPTFLSTTIDERRQSHSRLPPEKECAHSLGAVNLVAADAHEVDVHLIDVDVDLAGGLCGICVQEDLVFAAELADLLNILPDADLIVDQDDTHAEDFLLGLQDGLPEQLHVQDAVLVHGQVGDLEALKL